MPDARRAWHSGGTWFFTVNLLQRGRNDWLVRYIADLRSVMDDADFSASVDYPHFNPVKHGLVSRVAKWSHSTFHRLAQQRVYPPDWVGSPETDGFAHLD